MQPNKQVQELLLQRLNAFSPEDVQALDMEIGPRAAMTLMKLLPEVDFVFMQLQSTREQFAEQIAQMPQEVVRGQQQQPQVGALNGLNPSQGIR